MRIAIGNSALCYGGGGTERATVNLANEMAARGHKILIFSHNPGLRCLKPSYELNSDVRHLACDITGGHAQILYLKKLLIADKTDVFISMESDSYHLFWSMVCMDSGIPFICSERTDPVNYMEKVSWNRPGRLAVLSGADCVHELLPAYVSSIPGEFKDKTIVIPNAAPVIKIPSSNSGEKKRKQILYLARFLKHKRPDLLIEAFHMLLDKYPQWDLVMYGHGPEEKSLRRKIKKLRLESRVFIQGFCRDIGSAYANASIYCLPSAYEGFPNTLLEAMTAGLPSIGFEECTGARDVIKNGKTGLLVETISAEAFAHALDILISNENLRFAMGKAAKEDVKAYAPELVYDQWETLIQKISLRKDNTVMDSFYREPFTSLSRLSAVARREYLYRDFGKPIPYSFSWLQQKYARIFYNLFLKQKKFTKICLINILLITKLYKKVYYAYSHWLRRLMYGSRRHGTRCCKSCSRNDKTRP